MNRPRRIAIRLPVVAPIVWLAAMFVACPPGVVRGTSAVPAMGKDAPEKVAQEGKVKQGDQTEKKDGSKPPQSGKSKTPVAPKKAAGRQGKGPSPTPKPAVKKKGNKTAPRPRSSGVARRRQAVKNAAKRRQAQLDRARSAKPPVEKDAGENVNPFAPGRKPPTVGPVKNRAESGPSTVLDIAPLDTDVAPEEKTYSFSCRDCTYAQLVEGFARQTGLGVIGDAPKDGKVNFVTTEVLTFKEALGRMRMLLFNYKPLEPYWLVRRKTHLAVVRINDLYRQLEPQQMFRSVDEFRAANPDEDELALVIYTPTTGSIADLRVVRDFMPDYVRVAPLGSNSVTVFALVKDIRKYLGLIKVFVRDHNDPRTVKPIKIEHLLPSEAITRLETLMGSKTVGVGGGSRARSSSNRGRSKEVSALETIRAPGVIMMPLDAQGILLVRAMKDKIEQIEQLLPFIDIDTSLEDKELVTIPVKHADATELIDTVQQILAAYAVEPEPKGAPRRGSGRKKSVRAVVNPQTAHGVTLMRHPVQNAILVIADAEGVARVRQLVSRFDMPRKTAPTRIALEHVKAGDIVGALKDALGKGGAIKGTPGGGKVGIMPDPTGDALWLTGSDRDLKKARELISILDVAGDRVTLHVARIVHQDPSFVANVLREYAGAGVVQPAPPPGKRGTRVRQVKVSRFTPDDNHNRLYVLCTDEQWAEFTSIIQDLENAVGVSDSFVKLPVKNVEPDVVISRLIEALSGNPKHASVRYVPASQAVLVLGSTDESLRDIKALLPEVDRAVEFERRTFEIHHAKPAELKTAIELLMGAGTAGKTARTRVRPGKGISAAMPSASVLPELTIVELEDRLIVHATPVKMAQVAELIAELDTPKVENELKVYEDFPAGTDIDAIADTLAGELTGSPPLKGRSPGKARGAAGGPRFIPQTAAGRLIAIAPPTLFPRIERLLDALRVAVDVEPNVVGFIDLEHADPDSLIEIISPLLEMKVKELIAAGELEDGAVVAPSRKLVGKRPTVTSREGSHFHLAADARNQRLVIGAPQAIVDEARRLVSVLDMSDPDEVLFQTVELSRADPKEMVRAIREMMGSAGRRGIRKKPAKGGRAMEIFDDANLAVVEAPGGRAVALHGPAQAVQQAEEWIKRLDALSSPGRQIAVFKIEYADITRLGELIMNVVDNPPKKSPASRRPPRRPAAAEAVPEETTFELNKSWTGQDLYIQADLVAGTMIVAAPEAKLSEIRAIVEQFDTAESDLEETPVPKFLYTLEHRDDAFDAALDAEMLLGQIWDSTEETPTVDSMPFGNGLVVKYPDESRFDEIRELIRKYIDQPKPGYKETKKKGFSALKGLSASATALLLKMSHPDVEFEIIDVAQTKDRTWNVEEVKPSPKPGSSVHPAPKSSPQSDRCVWPLAFQRMTMTIGAGVLGQTNADQSAETTPKVKPKSDAAAGGKNAPPVQPEPTAGGKKPIDPLIEAAKTLMRAEPGQSEPARDAGEPASAKVRIYVDDAKGSVVIEGRQDLIDEAPTWFEEAEEEIKDLPEIPDIRVYRVRYLDVYSAAEILGEMFNATRQQRQTLQQQQRLAQQRQRQLQQQQQRQRQQAGQAGKGASGQPAAKGAQRGQPAQQAAVPTIPAESVRIYPNPRDRTLILRASTGQFPVLLKLLATIDQPQPINSEFKVFKLEKLSAVDVEALLKDLLGMTASRSTRPVRGGKAGTARRGAARSRSVPGNPGGYLPKTLMEKMATGAGSLGVDPKDIKLSSNEATNTIIVMAPKVALDFVGELIRKLESEQMPERLTHYYELKYADAESVADYLETQFNQDGGKGKKGKGGGAPAGRLNTPSFIPYTRLNQLTALATAEQLKEIDEIVARLDVGSETDQWEHVTLLHADAQLVADTLTKMFGGAASSSSRGKGKSVAGPGAQFIGEAGGRTVLYSASQGLREQILKTIEQLEADASDQTKLRILKLAHAKPSDLATAIEEAYGKRKARMGKSLPGPQLTVTAHDPSGQLFIQSDERLFTEIKSLVKTLDQPRKVPFEFRIFPLQYAGARQAHDVMTKLVQDYVKLLKPDERAGLDAFSIEVNEQANALVVLGTPVVFGFLEENLPKIDTPAAKASRSSFLMVALKNAEATELAQIITRLWAAKGRESAAPPPQAEANRALNTLIVRGTQAQLDEIKREIIDPLESQTTQGLLTETITLTHARADDVAESINRIFEDKKRAMKSAGRDRAVQPLEFAVVVTPDASTNQVIVQASEENLALVRARIAELDQEDVAARLSTRMEIYPVSYADPTAVAKIINEWARTRSSSAGRKSSGGPTDVVSAVAEDSTRTVVVTATHANQLIVKGLIDSLDDESIATRHRSRHVLRLQHASADDTAKQLTEVFRAVSGRSRTEGSPTFVSDLKTNALIASVNDEELEEVNQLLTKLDAVPSKEIERVTEVYPLRHADPESLNTVVNSMFRPARGGVSSPVEQVNSWVEAATQTLIVTASPKNHAIVRALVDKADSETTAKREVKVVYLDNAAADAVAQTLTEIFIRSGRKSRGDQRITISALTGSKAILVKSTAEDFAEIQSVIEELDRDDTAVAEAVRVVPVRFGDATEMQKAMQEYLRKPGGSGGRGGELAGNVRLSVLTQSNALVVSGGRQEVERLTATIGALDQAGEEGSVPQIIPLQHAAAGDIAPNLEAMFAEKRGGGRTRTPPVIMANEDRLLVRADPTDLAAIRSLVAQLDTEDEKRENFRILSVASGMNVTDLADKVQTTINESAKGRPGAGKGGRSVPQVIITPDTRSGGLILAGSPQLFDDAENMVRALEKMGPSGGRGLRMIRLGRVPASEIQDLVDRLRGDTSGKTGRKRGRSGSTSRRSRSRRSGSKRKPPARRPK